MTWPIVFCHYGFSSYLPYTLAAATRSNPEARRILLGDRANRDLAMAYGWEHYLFEDYRSPLQDQFDAVYKPVRGKEHTDVKNGRNWLRFVFERWYFIEGFAAHDGLETFWHFDSDTMIVRALGPLQNALEGTDFTVQCNGICLNGKVTLPVLSDFNAHTVSLFKTRDFLLEQQAEFDSVSPGFSFNEMRAFREFMARTDYQGKHLMQYSAEIAFDDAIVQGHGFETVVIPKRKDGVKRLRAYRGCFYADKDGASVEFATLNLSWVPIWLFGWVLSRMSGRGDKIPTTKFLSKLAGLQGRLALLKARIRI